MRKLLVLLFSSLILTACGRLDSIPYNPPQTPESWLTIQPVARLMLGSHELLIVQPSTSAIVYLLGIITIAAGWYILRIRRQQTSRVWWGVALLLWGLGALLAGTSYEAFSYQIKCAGREFCLWTSGLEIVYLALSVASVDAMLVAEAYTCASGRLRRNLIRYAGLNFGLYLVIIFIGSLIPVKFLISFEFLILVLAPNLLIFLILNGRRYVRSKNPMDLALLGVWGWLILTIGAYFLYYLSGLTQQLWERGAWFSENDVLHVGLILWMVLITFAAVPRIYDHSALPKKIEEKSND